MGREAHADVLLAELAAEQWGVLSLGELRGCGLSDKAVAARVSRAQLHRMHRGVYAVGHANPPLEGRWLAAVKACGSGAVLSHYSAAGLWGILDWAERHPEVTVTGQGQRGHSAIRVHRSSMLAVPDVTRHCRIPVTSPGRTLLDMAVALEDRELRGAARRAQALHRVNVRQLAELLARSGRRRGSRRLAQAIADGPAPTRSELENLALDLITQAGLEQPMVNVPITVAGRRMIPDFRWPLQRLILEADGALWHDGPVARREDRERQALLEAHGDRVIRVTWDDVVTHPARTLARLTAAGVPRQGAQP